jgi:hypothetical protein
MPQELPVIRIAPNIVTQHIGAPPVRMEILRKGTPVRAVTLMEPFISLALKEGAHILALTFYRGAVHRILRPSNVSGI